jgi:hypothetical protein
MCTQLTNLPVELTELSVSPVILGMPLLAAVTGDGRDCGILKKHTSQLTTYIIAIISLIFGMALASWKKTALAYSR